MHSMRSSPLHVVCGRAQGDEAPTLCLSPTVETRAADAKHVLWTSRSLRVGPAPAPAPRSGEHTIILVHPVTVAHLASPYRHTRKS